MMYYTINEETARRAKEMISFYEYKDGSATAEYRAAVDEAAALAEAQKTKVSTYYHDKIDALLDKYARKLADWTNAYNRNRASCPSVMICGPAAFPTKKKARQNSREDALWREYEEINGILGAIKRTGTGAVDLADPHAREILEAQLAKEQTTLETVKARNAYWRKYGTFVGMDGLTPEKAEKLTADVKDLMERCPYISKPYPDYELTSIRGKIKRLQERIKELDRRAEEQDNPAGDLDLKAEGSCGTSKRTGSKSCLMESRTRICATD